MIELKEIPEWLVTRYSHWKEKRDQWLTKRKKEREMYYHDLEGTGTTFTLEQLKNIDQGSGIPVSINKIYPKGNQMVAMLSQTKPAFRIVGLDDRGKPYASMLDKAAKSIMYHSEAVGEEEEAIKNMCTMGQGINFVRPTTYEKFGQFGIIYENVDPENIIFDINAKKRSLQDMQGFFYIKEMTKEAVRKEYKEVIEEINRQKALNGEDPITVDIFMGSSMGMTTASAGTEPGNELIILVEYYDKKFTTAYFLEEPETGDILKVFKENLQKGSDFILSGAIDQEENLFVQRRVFLGNKQVAQEIIGITELPAKAKFFEWAGSPYDCYGIPHFTIGMQEAYDKALQSMLLNGILNNNAGWITPQDGISLENKPKWEKIGAKPGVVKEFTPSVIDGVLLRPEKEEVRPLSNFFPTILELMDRGIEEVTGITPVLSGDPRGAQVDVFKSLEQYQNSAMKRVQLMMNHINLVNESLGSVIIEYLTSNLRVGKHYAFFDEENSLGEITVLKEYVKDFKLGRYKVLSIASEALPTQRLAMASELFKIAQTTPDPIDRDIYIKKAFELSDMRGFDEMKEQTDTAKKLSQEVKALQDQIERDKELMKQYENRALNAEYDAKLTKKLAQAEAKVAAAEVEIKLNERIKFLEEAINKNKNKEKNT